MKQRHANNKDLENLKRQHSLTIRDIAMMLHVSVDAVKNYLCNPISTRHVNFSDSRLEHLKLVINQRYKKL